jgi:CspA family cold shock protein
MGGCCAKDDAVDRGADGYGSGTGARGGAGGGGGGQRLGGGGGGGGGGSSGGGGGQRLGGGGGQPSAFAGTGNALGGGGVDSESGVTAREAAAAAAMQARGSMCCFCKPVQ